MGLPEAPLPVILLGLLWVPTALDHGGHQEAVAALYENAGSSPSKWWVECARRKLSVLFAARTADIR